jgi:hypothetical protein
MRNLRSLEWMFTPDRCWIFIFHVLDPKPHWPTPVVNGSSGDCNPAYFYQVFVVSTLKPMHLKNDRGALLC